MTKEIRTWTVFKNTNNTLEGVEAVTFAMRQMALDEIEKESENVAFMSDATVKLIKTTLVRLEQENEKLTKQRDILLGQLVINDGEDVTVQISQSQFDEYNELKAENEKLKEENFNFEEIVKLCKCEQYLHTLQEIKPILELYANSWVDEKIYPNLKYDNSKAKEGLALIKKAEEE